MAVDPASLTGPSALTLSGNDEASDASQPNDEVGTRKIDPNSEDEALQAGIEGFMASMITNQLFLNNSLFNFAKEAIDEADQ